MGVKMYLKNSLLCSVWFVVYWQMFDYIRSRVALLPSPSMLFLHIIWCQGLRVSSTPPPIEVWHDVFCSDCDVNACFSQATPRHASHHARLDVAQIMTTVFARAIRLCLSQSTVKSLKTLSKTRKREKRFVASRKRRDRRTWPKPHHDWNTVS